MTKQSDFTEDEWKLVLEGPPSAGFLVVTASKGGMFRETFAMSKAYVEARAEHGDSELLDAIAVSKPKVDRTVSGSTEAVRDHALGLLRDATALVAAKATPEELSDYRRFILALSDKVANAHREHGDAVDEAEHQAIESIRVAIGA